MVQPTVAVVEAMARSWQRGCDGEGEVPEIEGGGEGSGERRHFFWSHTIGLAEICRLRPLG